MKLSRSQWIRPALICCTLACTVQLQTDAAISTTVPPFYQRLPAQSPAQSMVYGPGTTDGGPLPRRDSVYRHPTLAPQCEHLPQDNDLHSNAAMAPATVKQAQNLGIVLRSRTGAAEPFRTGHLVLWRAGKYALCKDAQQQHSLVYGAEWVVAFLLQDSPEPPPSTWADLTLSIQRGHLLELGSVVNGGIRTEALGEQLQGLASGWAQTEDVLLRRFVAVRAAWPANELQVDLTAPLGVATP